MAKLQDLIFGQRNHDIDDGSTDYESRLNFVWKEQRKRQKKCTSHMALFIDYLLSIIDYFSTFPAISVICEY